MIYLSQNDMNLSWIYIETIEIKQLKKVIEKKKKNQRTTLIETFT